MRSKLLSGLVVVGIITIAGCGEHTASDAGAGMDAQVDAAPGGEGGAPGAPGGSNSGGGAKPAPINLGEYQFGPTMTAAFVQNIFRDRIILRCVEAGLPMDCVRVVVVEESTASPPDCPLPPEGSDPTDTVPSGTVLFTRLDRPLPSAGVGPAAYAYSGDTLTIFGSACTTPTQDTSTEIPTTTSPPTNAPTTNAPTTNVPPTSDPTTEETVQPTAITTSDSDG